MYPAQPATVTQELDISRRKGRRRRKRVGGMNCVELPDEGHGDALVPRVLGEQRLPWHQRPSQGAFGTLCEQCGQFEGALICLLDPSFGQGQGKGTRNMHLN